MHVSILPLLAESAMIPAGIRLRALREVGESMGLLFKLLFAGKATSTHHKLAMDALTHLQRHDADEWQNVFLSEIDAYLKGSKAPDDEFKDFRNHVLHVRENGWGGAIGKAEEWYRKTVQALSGKQWSEAVYNAGVLSHYFTDPFQPFHTAQSEREMIVHRAGEWSIAKSYEELQLLLTKELGGYPDVKVAAGDDWLSKLIRQGAEKANSHYDLLIDHYHLEIGVKNPPMGFDRDAKLAIAGLIGQAVMSFARTLEKAITEAGVLVPHVVVGLQAMFESMQAPRRAIAKRSLDARERAFVEAMFVEYKQTGKVLQTLSDDDKIVRRLHAEEVLKVPLSELDKQKPAPIGTKYSGPPPAVKAEKKVEKKVAAETLAAESPNSVQASKVVPRRDDLNAPKLAPLPTEKPSESRAGESQRSDTESDTRSGARLTLDSALVDAPSIGPKTAERFVPLSIRTVREFLAGSPEKMAASLNVSHITTEKLTDWQDQTRLVLGVPNLRGRESQLLVAIGIRTLEELARSNARDLHELIKDYCQSAEGKWVLRDAKEPGIVEVSQWVVSAKKQRMSKAA